MGKLIILNQPPYGTELSYNGLRLALALIKQEPEAGLEVFLLGDAVLCAKSGQTTPNGYYNIERMIKRVILAKGMVHACGTCLDARGLSDEELVSGVERGTMDGLAKLTNEATKVLIF